MVLAFAPEMAARKSKQFGTNQRQEAVGGCTIAIAPTGQHFGDFPSLHYSHSPPKAYWALILAEKAASNGVQSEECRFQQSQSLPGPQLVWL